MEGSDHIMRNSALESYSPLDFQSTVYDLVSKALKSIRQYKFRAFLRSGS